VYPTKLKTNLVITTVDGSYAKVMGVYALRFKVHDLGSVTWPFAVLCSTAKPDVLMGMDFMKAFKCSIDCESNRILFEKRPVHKPASACTLLSRKKLHLPAYAMRTISVPVDHPTKDCLVSSTHPAVVEGVCRVKNGRAQLLLINPYTTPLKIARQSDLGISFELRKDQLVTQGELRTPVASVQTQLPTRDPSPRRKEKHCLKQHNAPN
jgi:hypothetical protein